MKYKEFRIEAVHDHTAFRVEVKGTLFGWGSGYMRTDYFALKYDSQEDAERAIKMYKGRFIYPD